MLVGSKQRGAAAVEFYIVALFALLPLCLGMLQASLLMTDNHHIDLATFNAVRAAAMQGGQVQAARRAFSSGISVLFVDSSRPVNAGNVAQVVAAAYAAATLDQARFARFRVLAPDEDAIADFAVTRGGIRVIPNDGLEYRPMTRGRRSGRTLQEANVLRIEVTYCRPLIVPLARELLLGSLRLLDHDPWSRYCHSAGRIPVRSFATSPMQSDFRASS